MLVKHALDTAKSRIWKLVLFSGIINIMTLSGSIYMLQVYDRVIPARSFATLAGLSAILIFVYMLQGYFDSLRSRMLARIGAMFDQSLQRPIFANCISMRLRGYDTASVTQPTRDLEVIRMFLSSMGPTAFLDLPWTPIFLFVLFLFHWVIGLAATFGMILIIGVTYFIDWRTRGHIMEVNKLSMVRMAVARVTAFNAEVVHALGMRNRFATQWRDVNDAYVSESIRIRDIEADMGSIGKMLRYILQSSILAVGASLVITEHATGGIMIASSIMMGRALAPIEVALGNWKQFKLAREAVDRLTEMLSKNIEPPMPVVTLPRPSESLAVTNLAIRPPLSNDPVVSEINFILRPGNGLAILGPSGSGKTSLARALTGIWLPSYGEIRLDNAHLDQWNSDELGKHIGYMPQDVALFEGTIAENIARFDKEATDDAVIEAATLAGAHEMIISFPQGYSRNIGENGGLLSAGQRQRIALARAVYGNPFLVVLDEPNANLDSAGESELTNTIIRLRNKKCIVIVISHRVGSLGALDLVMILNKGKIVAYGPTTKVISHITPPPAREATAS